MSEWWTYRLSDFLMFAPRTYYRLVELYNLEVWPGQLAGALLGAAMLFASWQTRSRSPPLIWAALAGCWIWVAWAFLLQRYASINWAASWFAAAFALQGGLLILIGSFAGPWGATADGASPWGATADGASHRRARGPSRAIGCALVGGALVHPWIAVLAGRPWRQAEVFGLAPDPTVLATLGLLLLARRDITARKAGRASSFAWLLWPIPMLWCLVSGATRWTMAAPEAWLMPCAGLLAALAAWPGRFSNPRRAWRSSLPSSSRHR